MRTYAVTGPIAFPDLVANDTLASFELAFINIASDIDDAAPLGGGHGGTAQDVHTELIFRVPTPSGNGTHWHYSKRRKLTLGAMHRMFVMLD